MRKYFFILVLLLPFLFNLFLFGADPLPQNILEAKQALGWEGWFTIAMFLLIFIGLATEVRPPDIVMLTGTGILAISGVLSPEQFLEGFSNEIIMTIAMLCIIVRAMEVNGLLEIIAKRILTQTKNFAMQMLSVTVPVAGASAFLNNTPIVLLLAPVVRNWANKNNLYPSKFLIPLSFAAIFGGICTLIGTSTNLVVHGLLQKYVPGSGFTFFELAFVGVPITIAGILYLVLFSRWLLPERQDPASTITEETREFTAEFIIGEECPIANKTIKEASWRYLRGELLIQIERNNAIIDSPDPDFVLFVGDRLVFVGDINQIAELHTIKDFKSVADPHFRLDVSSSHFSEIVIPTTSILIGKTLRQINFRSVYGASVLAIYRQGLRVQGDVRDVELHAGDTLMLLSGEPWTGAHYYGKDFYYIRHHEKLVVFHPWRALFVVTTLIALVAAVTVGFNVMICSLAAVFVLMASRCVTIREAQKSIMWNILLLIASSFALGMAMETTGVAALIGEIILSIVGTNPYFFISGIIAVTIILTEVMSNNAAALIVFPIALTAAKLAGFTSPEAAKAVGVAVAVGASCAFAIPTGYQTHMIVYGPGGYKFSDFLRVGVPMDVIGWLLATAIIPLVWQIY